MHTMNNFNSSGANIDFFLEQQEAGQRLLEQSRILRQQQEERRQQQNQNQQPQFNQDTIDRFTNQGTTVAPASTGAESSFVGGAATTQPGAGALQASQQAFLADVGLTTSGTAGATGGTAAASGTTAAAGTGAATGGSSAGGGAAAGAWPVAIIAAAVGRGEHLRKTQDIGFEDQIKNASRAEGKFMDELKFKRRAQDVFGGDVGGSFDSGLRSLSDFATLDFSNAFKNLEDSSLGIKLLKSIF